jgi:hypothetical protein
VRPTTLASWVADGSGTLVADQPIGAQRPRDRAGI